MARLTDPIRLTLVAEAGDVRVEVDVPVTVRPWTRDGSMVRLEVDAQTAVQQLFDRLAYLRDGS